MNKRQIEFLLKIMEYIEDGCKSPTNKPRIWQFCRKFGLKDEDITIIKKHLYSIL